MNVLSNYVKFELHMYITTVSDSNKQLEKFELHNYRINRRQLKRGLLYKLITPVLYMKTHLKNNII